MADNTPSFGESEAGAMASDLSLVREAVGGSHAALEHLVRRHQGWIYNLAVRMVWDRSDADDVTQEVLIKAITKLGSFRGDSAFRTWLYRIAVNHVLTMRRRRMETMELTFTAYGEAIDGMPDHALPDASSVPVDRRLLVHETKVACTLGMLLCLDRRQRLALILGEILEVGDAVGGELLEISPDNFRQILARARKDLYSFMSRKCGLVDPGNPCRCARKTKAMIASGRVDPANLRFMPDQVESIRRQSDAGSVGLDAVLQKGAEVIRQLAVLPAPDHVAVVRRLLATSDFRSAMDLGDHHP